MTPGRRLSARIAPYLVAALLIIGGVALHAVVPHPFVLSLAGQIAASIGLLWFVLPLLERLERFAKRSRHQV
jgi:hypothetical protein